MTVFLFLYRNGKSRFCKGNEQCFLEVSRVVNVSFLGTIALIKVYFCLEENMKSLRVLRDLGGNVSFSYIYFKTVR